MRFAAEVLSSKGEDRIEKTIQMQGQSIALVAENEAVKWPMDKAEAVSQVSLAVRTRAVTPEDVTRLLSGPRDARLNRPFNDCFRRLFSPYGYAAIDDNRPRGVSLIADAANDGQVWRLRAVRRNTVCEQLIRFTGDPRQAFAVMADDE